MQERFKNISFEDSKHTTRFQENSNKYGETAFFEVPLYVALNKEDPFNSQFISLFNPLQVYAVSENTTPAGELIYMITKPNIVHFNRQMFDMIFSELNISVKAHRVRCFVELTKEEALSHPDLVLSKPHPDGEKDIYALNKGGRDGCLYHEELAAYVEVFETSGIILYDEIDEFMKVNGYNPEEV